MTAKPGTPCPRHPVYSYSCADCAMTSPPPPVAAPFPDYADTDRRAYPAHRPTKMRVPGAVSL